MARKREGKRRWFERRAEEKEKGKRESDEFQISEAGARRGKRKGTNLNDSVRISRLVDQRGVESSSSSSSVILHRRPLNRSSSSSSSNDLTSKPSDLGPREHRLSPGRRPSSSHHSRKERNNLLRLERGLWVRVRGSRDRGGIERRPVLAFRRRNAVRLVR